MVYKHKNHPFSLFRETFLHKWNSSLTVYNRKNAVPVANTILCNPEDLTKKSVIRVYSQDANIPLLL